MPASPVGILIGDRLSARVDERRFRAAVNVMLVLAATALIVNR
ncbi:MAG: putative membrane protein YfcA [Myxococcota bacterium]